MLTDFLQLFKTFQGQLDRKQELDAKFFKGFVEPLWKAFDEIHDDYKISFACYLCKIKEPAFSFQALLEEIRHDSVKTMDLRSDLWNMSESIPLRSGSVGDGLCALIHALRHYFDYKTLLPFSLVPLGDETGVFIADDPNDPIRLFKELHGDDNGTMLWDVISGIDQPLKHKALRRILTAIERSGAEKFHSGEVKDRLYLEYCSRGLVTESSMENGARRALIFGLAINSQNWRVRAETIVDYLLSELQCRYHDVGRSYYKIRVRLLA